MCRKNSPHSVTERVAMINMLLVVQGPLILNQRLNVNIFLSLFHVILIIFTMASEKKDQMVLRVIGLATAAEFSNTLNIVFSSPLSKKTN